MGEAALKKNPATMVEVIGAVRQGLHLVFAQEPSAITGCEKRGDKWVLGVEMIESKARLDNNDLIAAYEVEADLAGQVTGYSLKARFFRMDRTRTREGGG